ncbi:MAG: AAA family ATPase [Acidobacteriota bacterium]|nr:AAA family ATPase [Acidobacteriota bacterium]
MRQFLSGDEAAFRELEERARRSCILFRDQELPPGCQPGQADVGFESAEEGGGACLLVTRGVQYRGQSAAVREWIAAGEKRFPSFAVLREWIQGPLAESFGVASVNNSTQGPAPGGPSASNLTDMPAVREGIRVINRAFYMDEDALFARLEKRVLGQEAALKVLSSVMVRHCARRRPARPAVVFAVGPSGVGKTRTAEVLAEVLREFDDENNGYQFLRLDMSEYQEEHRVSQLIGAPQGYIGHGEGSQLLDALRANPRTIVLFDEIEKAHPAILRVLMNAMDAGRLSTAARSSSGREVDCRYAVFMFTSNLDSKEILAELESRNAFGNRTVEDEVCRRRLHAAGIAPEIVGRIGRFLVYRALSPEIRAEIVALAIAEVAEEYGLKVAFVEPNVVVELMQKVRSENFGVRPERYLIDDLLGGAFAKAAKLGVTGPVTVSGPPYECRPNGTENLEEVTPADDSERSSESLPGE